MTGMVLLAASAAAVAAFAFARLLVPDPVRLASRVEPYAARVRQRLGTNQPVATSTGRSVWGPIVAAAAGAISAVAEVGQTSSLEQRLRQAGMDHLTAERYRRRLLVSTVTGVVVGTVFAGLVGAGAAMTLALSLGVGFIGLSRWRATVDKRIEQRRAVMRIEAQVLCQLLAVYLQTGDTPMTALDRLSARTTGVVADELARAITLIRRGAAPGDVFEHLSGTTAEPAAARLYRLVGATWPAGGDPTALMSLAEVLRTERREDLARRMAKRRTAMVLPLVLVIGPILILFIAAAIPSIVLGR